MITIDGLHGEGGGQVLRTAIAISALSGIPVRITNIRKGRPHPGLAAQHLAGIRLVSQLCDGTLEGATAGSSEVTFTPGRLTGGTFEVDVGTAGAITLVLQATLLPALFCEKQVKLKLIGGTDVPWSPPLDYCRNVLLPSLAAFGSIQLKLEKRGYYPAGQGCVEIVIKGTLPRGKDPWERYAPMLALKHPLFERVRRPAPQAIKGVAHSSVPGAAAAMAETARLCLAGTAGATVDIRVEHSAAASPGGGITLWAVCAEGDEIVESSPRVGASGLLAGKSAADMAAKAGAAGTHVALSLLRELRSGAPTDAHLADQLVPFLALCGKGAFTTSAITTHTTTNIDIVRQMLGVRSAINGTTITKH
jgi:RNA 3'-phosphate cyclase